MISLRRRNAQPTTAQMPGLGGVPGFTPEPTAASQHLSKSDRQMFNRVERMVRELIAHGSVDEGNGDTLDPMIDDWTRQMIASHGDQLTRDETRLQHRWTAYQAKLRHAEERRELSVQRVTDAHDAYQSAARDLGIRWEPPAVTERRGAAPWRTARRVPPPRDGDEPDTPTPRPTTENEGAAR